MSKARSIFELIEFVGLIGMLVTGASALWEVSVTALVLGPLAIFLSALVLAFKSPAFLGFLALTVVGAACKGEAEKRDQIDVDGDYDFPPADDIDEPVAVVPTEIRRQQRWRRIFEYSQGYGGLILGLCALAALLWLFSGGAMFDFGRIVVAAMVSGAVMLIGWLGYRWRE